MRAQIGSLNVKSRGGNLDVEGLGSVSVGIDSLLEVVMGRLPRASKVLSTGAVLLPVHHV
jgi:hypothetical protein